MEKKKKRLRSNAPWNKAICYPFAEKGRAYLKCLIPCLRCPQQIRKFSFVGVFCVTFGVVSRLHTIITFSSVC